MIWWLIFVVSILANVFFVWYFRIMLSKFSFLSDNLDDLLFRIDEYKNHVSSVSEMDLYIGDPTIIGLIKHTKDLREFLADYQTVFLLDEEEQNEEEEA
tara:strand:+ start:79 stop:375 length:297 start_codon:yes stop_codon:yes gene_type:complete